MEEKQSYILGNVLSLIGAGIIFAACRNLEVIEGIVLAIAAVLLFVGARMSAAAKAKSASQS